MGQQETNLLMRTLKTEQERIKHNVNESLEINRKQKRAKQTKVV